MKRNRTMLRSITFFSSFASSSISRSSTSARARGQTVRLYGGTVLQVPFLLPKPHAKPSPSCQPTVPRPTESPGCPHLSADGSCYASSAASAFPS